MHALDGAEGDDSDRDKRAGEGDERRGDEQRALDQERRQVFLEEELDAVGERLQQAEGADTRGSPAVLHATDELAFEQHRIGDRGERDDQHHDDLEDRQQNEDLELGEMIEKLAHCLLRVSVKCSGLSRPPCGRWGRRRDWLRSVGDRSAWQSSGQACRK